MRTEQIKYFLEAAECGSMSEVADRNFLTQPAVSTAIAKLEEELETTLIVRTTHGVELTSAGRRARETFLVMRDLLETLQKDLEPFKRRIVHQEEGAINLAATLELSIGLVDTAMKLFYQEYPNCIFSIREYDFLDILAVVGKGMCELGVFCIVDELLEEAAVAEQLARYGLTVEKIGSDRLMIGVKADAPLAKKEQLPLKSVLQQPLAIFNSSAESCWHDHFLARYPRGNKVVKTNRESYLMELVLQKGFLVFILNGSLLQAMDKLAAGVTLVPIKEPIKITTGILRRQDEPLSPLAAAFVALLKKQLRA